MGLGGWAVSRRGALVRSNQWWDHKVPPEVAVAAVSMGVGAGSPGADRILDLLLILISIIGIAAFGHLVNDWADIDADDPDRHATPDPQAPKGLRTGASDAPRL